MTLPERLHKMTWASFLAFFWGPKLPTPKTLLVSASAVWRRYNNNDSTAATESPLPTLTWAAIENTRNAPDKQDRALAYIGRILDRQLNKCRGILTFNGILLASVKLAADSVGKQDSRFRIPALFMLIFCAASLLVSCLLLLNILFVHWGEGENYETFGREFKRGFTTCEKRSCFIAASIRFSVGSVLMLLVLLMLALVGLLLGV